MLYVELCVEAAFVVRLFTWFLRENSKPLFQIVIRFIGFEEISFVPYILRGFSLWRYNCFRLLQYEVSWPGLYLIYIFVLWCWFYVITSVTKVLQNVLDLYSCSRFIVKKIVLICDSPLAGNLSLLSGSLLIIDSIRHFRRFLFLRNRN